MVSCTVLKISSMSTNMHLEKVGRRIASGNLINACHTRRNISCNWWNRRLHFPKSNGDRQVKRLSHVTDIKDFVITKALRGVECWTDRRLIRAKVR